jgi:hypothetical protein
MRDYRNPAEGGVDPTANLLPSSSSVSKVLSTLFGIGLMIVGTWYILWLIGRIWWGMAHPLEAQTIVAQWAEVLGAEELKLTIPALQEGQQSQTLGIGKLAAGVGLGMGHLAVAYLAALLINAGSRVLTYASSDREAIKRLIKEAFPDRQS